MLKISKELRRLHISHGRTITANVRVSFVVCHSTLETKTSSESSRNQKQKANDGETVMRGLHHSVEKSLGNLLHPAKKRIDFLAANGFSIYLHFAFSSYIVGLPEAEDMLALKRGTNTPTPCHLCHIKKNVFHCAMLQREEQHTFETKEFLPLLEAKKL